MNKTRIGINGFGRVGRCVAKILMNRPDLELVAINDLDTDYSNLSYLFNYDSTYGRSDARMETDGKACHLNDKTLAMSSVANIDGVAWEKSRVDVVIDSSGVTENVHLAHRLTDTGRVKKVLVTHSPPEDVDHVIIMGVNESTYRSNEHHVVSSSICDANAIAPVLVELDKAFGIRHCSITTLHPWLSYQNLVDAPLRSVSKPGHFWKDYSLGRASVGALIPKETTAAKAIVKVCSQFEGKLEGFSYRIPTNVVTSADLTFVTEKPTTRAQLRHVLEDFAKASPFVSLNRESLISVDYERTEHSAIIDDQWTRVLGDHMGKIILWYDNEWGYSSRVADIASHLMRPGKV